jgi:hypothetical protein
MNRTLYGKNAASFRFKTLQIVASYCCCRLLQSRDSLRVNPAARNMLYFNRGLDRLNQECDIATVVKHIRILKFFLRTVLDKDQRVILKLKAKEFLDTDNDEFPQDEFHKKTDKHLLLDLYIDYI